MMGREYVITLRNFNGVMAGVDVGYLPVEMLDALVPLKGAIVWLYYENGGVIKWDYKIELKKVKMKDADMERIVLEKALGLEAVRKADVVFMDGDLRKPFLDLKGAFYWVVKSPQRTNLGTYEFKEEESENKKVVYYRFKGPVYRMETFLENSLEILSYLPPITGYPSVLYEADRLSRIRRMDIDPREIDLFSHHHRLFRPPIEKNSEKTI